MMIKNSYTLMKFLLLSLFIFSFSNSNAGLIFVSNEGSDTLTVLDSQSKDIIKIIEVGGRPRDMKISHNKKLLYLAVSEDNKIQVIDIPSLEIVDFINTGDDPEIFDIDPSGKILVVSNEDDNEATVINIKDKKIIFTIKNVGIEPEGVSFSSDGKKVFITSEGTNSVIIIDPWKGEVLDEILVGNRPRRGVFLKNGREYWVSNELSATVTVIDTKDYVIKKTISFKKKGIRKDDITPVDFAVSEKLNRVYVSLGSANHVAVVDINKYKAVKYILVGNRVWGAALNSDESELVVTNGNSDDISIIDTKSLSAKMSIAVGKTPHTVRILD